MLSGIHHLPYALIFCVITIPLIVLIIGIAMVSNRLFPHLKNDQSSFEIMDAFIAVASVAGVVLAFTLVEVDTKLETVANHISIEAEAINGLDRTLLGYGDGLSTIRTPLLAYAKDIVDVEWPLLAYGKSSESSEALLNDISAAIHAQAMGTSKSEQVLGEALRFVDQMDLMREERLAAASGGLPGVFWKSVCALFLMLALIASQTEASRKRFVAMGVICATLGLLLSLTVIFDAPFGGETAVWPHEIERVIGLMTARG